MSPGRPPASSRRHSASIAIVVLMLLSGCALAPSETAQPEPAMPCAEAARHVEEGTASWYGASHHGKPTASGERFDMGAMTAAHRRLPLGTTIKVTNLRNSREATFRINDRGPYARSRVLDVSQKGAQTLGFADAGTTRVRIQTVGGC